MARVLVTGCCGFLGSHLADALSAAGHYVIGVDNMLGGDKASWQPGENARFYEGDCSRQKTIAGIVRDSGPQVVYHLAAAPHEGLSVFSPATVTRHTFQSTAAVASASIDGGVKRLVYASSMARYGEGGKPPFTENQPVCPVDPYGIAKVASEDLLSLLGKIHGMEVVVAVPHNIYGSRQRYWDPYRNVAAIMANLMLQGRQPYIYGDGRQQRVFSHVSDCIPPLMRMGFEGGLDGEVINIGPDEGPIAVTMLAVLLAELIGFKGLKPVYLPARPCEVKRAWPSADKARRLLGYRPQTDLVDGLSELVGWVKEKGPREFEYHIPLEIVNEKTPRSWKERLF